MDGSSTVRLLETRAGATTAELLGLAAARVGDEERPVVAAEDLLHLLLGRLVDVLLVVGDERLGDGLADRVDLAHLAAAAHADPHVDALEAGLPGEQDRLQGLEAEHLWADELDRRAADLDEAAAGLAVGTAIAIFLLPKHWTLFF